MISNMTSTAAAACSHADARPTAAAVALDGTRVPAAVPQLAAGAVLGADAARFGTAVVDPPPRGAPV